MVTFVEERKDAYAFLDATATVAAGSDVQPSVQVMVSVE
jgi:hypothetical protein